MPFLDAQRGGVIKFRSTKLPDPNLLKVPYGGVKGDSGADWIADAVKEDAPFTGTGYTRSFGNNLVPEWKANGYFEIDDGAELWILEEGQPPKLVMRFDKPTRRWVALPFS